MHQEPVFFRSVFLFTFRHWVRNIHYSRLFWLLVVVHLCGNKSTSCTHTEHTKWKNERLAWKKNATVWTRVFSVVIRKHETRFHNRLLAINSRFYKCISSVLQNKMLFAGLFIWYCDVDVESNEIINSNTFS